jgi:sigma-B regulation protein RsbQ
MTAVQDRVNARLLGEPTSLSPVVLVHGFGCDQHMWRHVAPSLAGDRLVVLLDLVGSGGSDLDRYDEARYADLQAHADDLVDLLVELDLRDVVLVGHSVSSMVVALAQVSAPERVGRLVMVSPSARYVDDVDYVGGFAADEIDELLTLMERNHQGWQAPLSSRVAGAESAAAVRDELFESFCRTRPDISRHFAEVTFRGDNRADLPRVGVPVLVLQSADDTIAPVSAGRYVADHLPDATFEIIDTVGHCPHLSAPGPTASAINTFLSR